MDMQTELEFQLVLEQLEKRINRRARQGLYLLLVVVLFVILMVFYSPILDEIALFIFTGLFFILAFGSLGYSYHWGRNGRRFLHSLKILSLISPPYPILQPRIAVVDRYPIYIIAKWGKSMLFLVRLLDPKHTQSGSTQLPRFLTRHHTRHQIEGVNTARIEGTFSFPLSSQDHIEGNGVLYALPLERDFWRPRRNPISSNMLMTIIRRLTLDDVTRRQESQ